MPLERQDDPAWAVHDYGGYYYGDTLIGQERTVAEWGCYLACLAMADDFYNRISRSLGGLADDLAAQPGGFLPRTVARVTDVVGDSVRCVFTGRQMNWVGRGFLIELGPRVPVATVWITSQTDSVGTGLIGQQFEGRQVEAGQRGCTYAIPNGIPDAWGKGPRGWRVEPLGRGPGTASRVESSMAQNWPVALRVGVDSVTGIARHWVIADGRAPAFLSASDARGTYRIKDPGGTDDSGAPLRRLLQRPYGNRFTGAVCFRSVEEDDEYARVASAARHATARPSRRVAEGRSGSMSAAGLTEAASVAPALAFVLQGPATLALGTPAGRHVAYDSETQEYSSDVPGAVASSRFMIGSAMDTALTIGPLDVVQIPDAVDGTYSVVVTGTDTGNCALDVYDPSGVGEACRWTTFGDMAAGRRWQYQVSYVSATRSVSATAVAVNEQLDQPRVELAATPNPVSGVMRIGFTLRSAGPAEIRIYDVEGRCVDTLLHGTVQAGRHLIEWNTRDSGGSTVDAGVYFVRLVCDGRTAVRRIVVLR